MRLSKLVVVLFGIFFTILSLCSPSLAEALSSSTTTSTTSSLLDSVSLHKVYLRNPSSFNNDEQRINPWCYAATVDPTSSSSSSSSSYNFLATQVWPSAREASFFLERYIRSTIIQMKSSSSSSSSPFVVCELGCGPGLPSLVVAAATASQQNPKTNNNIHVVATDIDSLALEMVQKAANEQGLTNLETKYIDLIQDDDDYFDRVVLDQVHNNADLYVLSDVFENQAVARGAARLTTRILQQQATARVWCFAQSDRAQREIYRRELEEFIGITNDYGSLRWQTFPPPSPPRSNNNDIMNDDNNEEEEIVLPSSIANDRLLLIGLDELNVMYG